MTRQEGIREKIFAILVDSQRLSLKECGETTDKILEGISKLGAALKVERESPENPWAKWHKVDPATCSVSFQAIEGYRKDLAKAGCGFFEPLIKEGK